MIRLATKEDIPELSKLWVEMIKELEPDWEPNADVWIKNCENLLDSGSYGIGIAIEDDKMVGFIDGMTYYDPASDKIIGFGKNFYVARDYRGTDIAEELMITSIVEAQKRGVETLEMQCYPDKLEYWVKHGFEGRQIISRMVI